MIIPSEPIIIPPIPSTIADTYWLTTMTINAPNFNKSEVFATLTPFNSATGETFDNLKVDFYLDNILALAQSQPELANAMSVILTEIERQAKIQGLI